MTTPRAIADTDGPPGRLSRPALGGRGSKQTDVRVHNEQLLLSLVRRHGALAKADIARLTGLSPQTVSVIMRRLETEGLLARQAPVRGRVGQPSIPMTLAADGVYSLGLKIGRRSVELVLMDFVGTIRQTRRRSYAWPLPDAVLAFARTEIAAVVKTLAPAQRKRIAGLGIALPFELWNWAEEVGAPQAEMDAWHDADLLSELEASLPFPVLLQNDATSACVAEVVLGRGSAYRDFFYFFIGFFIGGGVVINGSVFTGSGGNAGAIGSMPVPTPQGRSGSKSVQLIDAASVHMLESRLKAAGIDPSPLWRQPQDWSSLAPHLDAWIAEIAPPLAHAIVATSSVIDFPAVIIDGGFPAEVRRRIVAATQSAMLKLDLKGIQAPAIVEGQVGPNARAIGGACLPLLNRYILDQTQLVKAAV
ncbi:MAG TPA: ROK family transcriptional regulator [Dongiaceae bacterium]|nr:ROK family transcriptional regulator [Dongiaceae bacterium]